MMKVETLNLHGLNAVEARDKTRLNIDWAIKHNVDVLVINHGKGLHSSGGFAILKSDIRKMLKEEESTLRENGYIVVYGESNQPIALTYDEGNTLIVTRGLQSEFIGGNSQQERNRNIFSEEGRLDRKAQKNWRKNKYR